MREEEKEIRRGGGGSQTIIDFKGNFHKTFREYSSQSSAASMSRVSVLVSCRAQLLAESRPEKQGPRQTQHWVSESGCWRSRPLTHPAAGDPGGLASWPLQFFFIALSLSDIVFSASVYCRNLCDTRDMLGLLTTVSSAPRKIPGEIDRKCSINIC